MNAGKKILIMVVAVALAISGVYLIESNYYFSPQNTTYSPQLAASTVYIENGVSGVVTLTDPFLNKTININVVSDPMDSGSGVTVTKDGYIVTAFHVVSDPDTLDNQDTLKKMNSSDINHYVEEAAVREYISNVNPQLGTKLLNGDSSSNSYSYETNQQDISAITETLSQKNLLTVKSSQQVIKVKFPASVNGGNSLNASLIDVGNPGTDEDVAILKVNPVNNNLPVLSVSSQKPTIGESVSIYGYPGNDSGNYQKTQSSVTPKSTSGSLISEISSYGTVYYKTSAPTASGYSGGPVFNSQNNVMGILIYGSIVKQQSKTESGIFLSSDYIIQICKANNVSITVV
ncbi:S1 family peptidase [Methanobacterium paludis]|uniref:Peptidase S1 and S6 chymotrypsin/Hap n=1 Tax=Methanobacterium paludis (strain DSM 25820 / JCM 18151 / SWAN1) TaxID=868131 RepID=F6D894_METPW|nr:serine protease [Methanobacterium paludis]AEG17833.1 hypothetical protein MSWAN_0805 [Methanobacterium paludis]